ncbi:MAG: hypothetical protein AMXMBFR13_09420 [Phycisphaerae bacterium]
MNPKAALILVAWVVALPTGALADTWCNSNYPPDEPSCHSSAIYCNSVDRLCNGAPACPPPPPEECPDSSWSWAVVRSQFPRTSRINDTGNACGVEFKGDEDTKLFDDPPLGLRHPAGDLGQATVDLTGDIQYTFGEQYDAVGGSDQEPLVLRYDVSGGVAANFHAPWDIGVLELFLDTGVPNQNRSPMDYILVGADNGSGCINCNSSCPPGQNSVPAAWPFVCQSYETRNAAPFCPPLQTNVRTAVAVGINALLDNNPCHCDTPSNQKPTNPYLTYYDGLKWRILHPDRPGPEGENAVWSTTSEGMYFVIGAKINVITMTVRTNTVDITMFAKNTPMGGGVYEAVTSTVTGLKRHYVGQFNKLHLGSSIGCQISSESYTCQGNRHCIHMGYDGCDGSKPELGTKWLEFDKIAVSGGTPGPGACCLGGSDCATMLPDECIAAGGTFAGGGQPCGPTTCRGACCLPVGDCSETYVGECPGTFQGLGTDCATTRCPCPTPFPDADADGDVDQSDFGKFQACFTGDGLAHEPGLCQCFDRDNGGEGDGDVDEDDLTAFVNCVSGPDIPADPGC